MRKVLSLILLSLFTVTLAACSGDDLSIVPEDILDCIADSTAEGCDDIIDDITDDRSVEEILADTIIENWDGELTHISLLMDAMDIEDAIEVETEFSFSVIGEDGNHYIHVVMIETTLQTEEGMILHRVVDFDLDGEEIIFEIIFKEVPTGVHVYYNAAPLKELLLENGDEEPLDLLDVIGATEDWFMFKFDDSLASMIEIEVIKDIIVSAFFEEVGESFFYDLQDQLDFELTINTLSTYGINIGLFFDYLIEGDIDNIDLMLEAIDIDSLLLDLDAAYLVPEINILLDEYSAEFALEGFVTADQIVFLNEFGTKAWLNQLTDSEIIILIEVLIDANSEPGDPDLSVIIEEHLAGTLDHYLIMQFLNDPEVSVDLSEIPGFDFDGFKATMDTLDYDAFYLEMLDMEALYDAIYNGQVAFDLYLVDLALTAPQNASILTAFSGIVFELEAYKYLVDDINYVFDNLIMFDKFFTLDYYLDNDLLKTEIEKTDEFGILTTVTLEPISYVFILQDLIEETVLFLDGVQSFELPYIQFINCPTGETCEPLPEYTDLMMDLALFGEVEYTVLYNPINSNEITTKIDFTDFINKLAMIDGEVTAEPVINLSFQVTVREAGEIVIAESVNDVNMIAEDFAKFSLSMFAYEALENVAEYYFDNFGEITLDFGDTRQLDTFGEYIDLSLAFDLNLSYVQVGGSLLAPDYSIQLFWSDGTKVFTGPLGLAELADVVMPETGIQPTNEMFQYFVDKVEDENFNMTKLIFVYIFNETNIVYEDTEEEVPTN